MIIIFKNDKKNIFLKFQLLILEIPYVEVFDLNEIIDKKNTIKEEYVFILNKDYGFLKDFYFNLEHFKNLKNNTILGHSNFKINESKS